MSSQVHQAREALGARLRDLRKDAGLTGRALARLSGWQESKVSRIEYGRRAPSEDDIRAWCRHTDAEDQVPDLIATLRNVEAMWMDYRKMLRAGLKRGQQTWAGFEEMTSHFRWYEQFLIPGLLQTAQYAAAVLTTAREVLELPGDVDDAVQARVERQRILYTGDRRFSFLLEQQALSTRFGDGDVLAGQLDRLLVVMGLPRVSLGIIPAGARRHAIPDHSFVMFDEDTVRMETVTAEVTVTQPQEIAAYVKTFELLHRSAVHGSAARELIRNALPI